MKSKFFRCSHTHTHTYTRASIETRIFSIISIQQELKHWLEMEKQEMQILFGFSWNRRVCYLSVFRRKFSSYNIHIYCCMWSVSCQKRKRTLMAAFSCFCYNSRQNPTKTFQQTLSLSHTQMPGFDFNKREYML